MKKLITILSIFVLLTSFTFVKDDNVYICNSTTAVAYHSIENCRGLNKCTHGVIKITKTDALNKYDRRACKIYY